MMRQICVRFASDDSDRWAELYWKKQLGENLISAEEKELEKLEEENMETIEEVYNSLSRDREVQNWIEKIKTHEWVKTIEGEMSGVRDSRNLSDCSVLSHSDNRRICGSAFDYAQICSTIAPQTSHIPKPLCAMLYEDGIKDA